MVFWYSQMPFGSNFFGQCVQGNFRIPTRMGKTETRDNYSSTSTFDDPRTDLRRLHLKLKALLPELAEWISDTAPGPTSLWHRLSRGTLERLPPTPPPVDDEALLDHLMWLLMPGQPHTPRLVVLQSLSGAGAESVIAQTARKLRGFRSPLVVVDPSPVSARPLVRGCRTPATRSRRGIGDRVDARGRAHPLLGSIGSA